MMRQNHAIVEIVFLPLRPPGGGEWVTRYAPSPTGYLHLGHAAHLLYVWGVGQRVGARILLRMEDHDRSRCKPAYEEAILEDLEWLGFRAENGLDRPSPFRQSDCDAVYREKAEALRAQGRLYGCACSRSEIARAVAADGVGERPYPGTCRDRGLPLHEGVGWRVPMDDEPAGDPLVRDREGQWTYQFAVVVDDLRHGVNLVIRGEDLQSSTGRQIRLAELLGRALPPVYLHHPLIVDGQGEKLSKRTGATPIRDLRRRGRSPEEVLGEAAWRAGLQAECLPVRPDEVRVLVSNGGWDPRLSTGPVVDGWLCQ